MNSDIRQLLEAVQSGETSVDDALLEIKKAPFEDIGYAKVDLHRKIRQGTARMPKPVSSAQFPHPAESERWLSLPAAPVIFRLRRKRP